MKSVSFALIILSAFNATAFAQEARRDQSPLEFGIPERQVENRISFNLSKMQIRALHATTGKKVDLKLKDIVINGDSLRPKRINSRGQSTLMYKRKSLSIRLTSKAEFQHGEAMESMKDFKLLSLSMDKYYCHNRLAFELMETVGLHHLFYSFCELQINDSSEGIYMVIERPEDWAFIKKESPVIIRRGFDHTIDEIKTQNITERDEKRNTSPIMRRYMICLTSMKAKDFSRCFMHTWILTIT